MTQRAIDARTREDGTVRTRDGTQIAYTVHRGSGAARLALVHSLAMDRSFWDAVVAEIDGDVDVLTHDCRGHGASGKPDVPYTAEQFAQDLADLLDAVGWQNAIVAGASMGGCVSLAFAGAYPERTAGLALIDTTSFYGDDAPRAWAERADKALAGGMTAMVDFQKTRWFSDAFRERAPEVVEAAVEVFVANDVRTYARTCHMLGAADLRPALASLSMPVRILVGEEDYATPVAMAQAMQAAIPHARLEVLAAVRHFTPLEVPHAVATALNALCKEASAR